jgi:hypothetical protein
MRARVLVVVARQQVDVQPRQHRVVARVDVAQEATTRLTAPDAGTDLVGTVDGASTAGTTRHRHGATVARTNSKAARAAPSVDDPTGVITVVVHAA